jgi:hypothetical protein
MGSPCFFWSPPTQCDYVEIADLFVMWFESALCIEALEQWYHIVTEDAHADLMLLIS